MSNYIILNDINSNTIEGLLISTLPPISKPMVRTTVEEIDGRDGDIITKLGYSAYDKTFKIGLYGNFDINQIISYFNSEGTVVFSNEPDKYYKYEILKQINFEKLIRYKTATVTMHVQPFKYLVAEEVITKPAEILTAEGTGLIINNTALEPFNEVQLKGDTEQASYEGRNQFNNDATANQSAALASKIDTGIRMTMGTTSSSSHYSVWVLKDLTNYVGKVVRAKANFEIHGTNNGRYYIGIGSSTGTNRTALATTNTSGNEISFTVPEFSDSNTYLILALYANRSGNAQAGDYIDYTNVIVTIDNNNMEYEKFVGGIPSPNAIYPQIIQTVKGSQQIQINNRNQFNNNATANQSPSFASKIDTGIRMTCISASSSSLFSVWVLKDLTNYVGKTIRAKADFIVNGSNNASYYIGLANSTGSSRTNMKETATSGKEISFVVPEFTDNKTYLILALYANRSGNAQAGDYIDYTNVVVTIDNNNMEYEPNQQQNFNITLPEGMELCKIGDYQDYIYKLGSKWYKYKAIGKIVLDGTENWQKSSKSTVNRYYINNVINTINDRQTIDLISNYFQCVTPNQSDNDTIGMSKLNYSGIMINFNLNDTDFDTLQEFKDWLVARNTAGNPLIVYYVLATPVEEEITDTTLLNQLEALSQANSYDEVTYILSNGNLPAIIYVKVYSSEKIQVFNSGNIAAKPTITIYGSGDIGVYLNDLQIFQIALGDEGQITLDIANMEAYNKITLELKNRLVVGDYNNFVLSPGANTINFSGIVTNLEISNYSRWL